MTAPKRLLIGVVLVVTTLVGAASTATAGTYEVRNCVSTTPLHFDGYFELYLNRRVDVVQNCNVQARGWVGIYQTRKGTSFAAGEGAGYRWYAPSGARFVASHVYGKLKNANGIAAQLYATNPSDGYYPLDANQPHDGAERQMYVDFTGQPRSQVAVRLACLTKPPCSNRASDVKAFFELREIQLRLADHAAPAVQAGGDLFQRPAGQPYRGVVNFHYSAADSGAGLWDAFAEINGSIVNLGGYACPGIHSGFADRTRPCPAEGTRHGSVNTASPPFGEGSNRVRICVRDYATGGSSNVGCSSTRQIVVDNAAPEAPQSLSVSGGEDWRPTNRFDLTWTNPPAGTTALAGIRYWIEDVTSGGVVRGPYDVASGASSQLRAIEVPWPGHFKIHIQLRDSAGNTGPAASRSLRFDDLPPGSLELDPAPAWLGADDFPLRLPLQVPPATGPSGLAGHAFSLADDEATLPCPTGLCQPSEIVTNDGRGEDRVEIERLPSGSYWLSAVAVSGAGLPSPKATRRHLRVDLGDPEVAIDPLPEGWARQPLVITARATDGQSGMAADSYLADRPPITAIEVPGQATVEETGDRAQTTIRREGLHQIRFWARDRAGNANRGSVNASGYRHDPPGRAIARIDWTPPKLEFLPPDPESPERIQVRLTDRHSGPAGGGVLIRPAGSSQAATLLNTSLNGDLLQAHFPSDELDDGYYEVSAYGVDRAGNSSAHQAPPPTVLMRVPLKAAASLSMAFAKKRRAARTLVKHGAGLKVNGRLRDSAGKALAGMPVELVERFRAGSRQESRVTALQTDSSGRFGHQLRPGPSREVLARFPGSQLLARAESSLLRLGSRAAIRLDLVPQVARNGEAVRMRGRVRGRGASIPRKGKLVAIQYLDPARRRWRPVELIRTDRRGRFRFNYNFRTVSSPQRFLFRAVAVPEAGWPYLKAQSGGRSVVVYPR